MPLQHTAQLRNTVSVDVFNSFGKVLNVLQGRGLHVKPPPRTVLAVFIFYRLLALNQRLLKGIVFYFLSIPLKVQP